MAGLFDFLTASRPGNAMFNQPAPGSPLFGDPDAAGAVQASQAMEPVTGPYLHDVLSGQMAAHGLQQFAPAQPYDPNMSALDNARTAARDPQALAQAMNIALSTGPGAIKAYHGSPHDFSAFDSSKIGTGEGAQAYGHGLYFAENPEVAGSYKNAGRPAGMGSNTYGLADTAMQMAKAQGMAGDDARKFAMEYLNNQAINAPPMVRQQFYDAINNFDDLLKVGPGRMYEVNINAEPDQFLNWDKPLKDQGSSIQDFIGSLEQRRKAELSDVDPSKFADYQSFDKAHGAALERAAKLRVNPDWTGAQLYESSKLVPGDFRDPAAASAALREAGIPGIRYLDQGSRGMTVEPPDIYGNWRAADSGGNVPFRHPDKATVEKWINDNTSHNLVVFDPSIIEILRKYGLAGLLGGAGSVAASNPYSGEPQSK